MLGRVRGQQKPLAMELVRQPLTKEQVMGLGQHLPEHLSLERVRAKEQQRQRRTMVRRRRRRQRRPSWEQEAKNLELDRRIHRHLVESRG